MSEKEITLNIEGPFGVDRRDSAIAKPTPGILYELENFFIHDGNAEVREGQTNTYSTLDGITYTSLNAGFRILSLFRFYGFDSNEEALKEFYAAVDGNTESSIMKWDGSQWNTLRNPPGMTLTPHANAASGERQPSLGNFEQFKDRTYYTNHKQPILMVKKEDDQLYEAGIPEVDAQLMIDDCEDLDGWAFYTANAADDTSPYYADNENHYLDGGFERHTEGSYGITLERNVSGGRVKAVKTLDSILDLEWFYKVVNSTITTTNTDGVRLIDSSRTGSNAFNSSYLGLQVKRINQLNTADQSTAIITKIISGTIVLTTPLSGGTTNRYNSGDTYVIGSYSTENDYIALDVFRFTQIDIDEVTIELSSEAPDANGDFAKGFHVTLYTDTDFEHFALRQRTMLAEWAMNPYANVLFRGRFRKRWFIHIDDTDVDDWSLIRYVRIQLQQNAQTSGDGVARITFDNIRLLKTPPLAAELKIQVATCDAIEGWTNVTNPLVPIQNDYIHAVEGVSCKAIPTLTIAQYDWAGTKDLSKYGTGVDVDGSDVFVFDLCGSGALTLGTFQVNVWLHDNTGNVVLGQFKVFNDLANLQQRHLNIQNFEFQDDDFDWSSVSKILIGSVGFSQGFYIDNIRIQPAAVSKMINKFMPIDLIIADAINRGIEHFFGENSIVDVISDILFHSYAKFTRQATGQGHMVFPEYQHGRYKFGDVAAPSLQMHVDSGGTFTMTFVQDNDLTQYQDFNFNLDAFWHPRDYDQENSWLGVEWVEVPSTPNDEFAIWFSTPDPAAIAKIRFRFYCNKNATWTKDTLTHTGANDAKILFKSTGATFVQLPPLIGHRIKNETKGEWGIVVLVLGTNKLIAWRTSGDDKGYMTWDTGDEFTIDGYRSKGFKFGIIGGSSKPQPDYDNYYEYVIDIGAKYGKSSAGVAKGIKQLSKYPSENEESWVAVREIIKEYDLGLVYAEKDTHGDTWTSGTFTWKRKDMIPHFSSDAPWASLQCIAAHEIIVTAVTKKNAVINFQDFSMTKKGAVNGEQITYKMKLEDELGFLGPASEASTPIDVKGSDVKLADLYVPYDGRIKRKRLYRSDSSGTYRYLDTIERIDTTYLDQIPDEMLGEAMEEDLYRPPKAAHIRKVDNRMAYIDCIDRRGNRRSSRVHLSIPFIPHQCLDADCFDLDPEDGQKVIWCEWYYGYLIVWKERSIYAVDPVTFQKSPRDLSIGCIAPLSVSPIPNIGFGWLSHEGIVFGDHSNIDKLSGLQVWPDIKGYTPEQLSHAYGFYHDDYYYIFLGYDDGVYNTKGFACYLPNRQFTTLTNWNAQCGALFKGGSDSNEIMIGTNYGYVYRIFDGEVDLSDDGANTETPIPSVIRTQDFDLKRPQGNKYADWILVHAKNLSSDPTRKADLVITPYYDQRPTKALDNFTIEHEYYRRYDSCVDPGYEDMTTLVGFRIEGQKRYALKGMVLDVTDKGFIPFQKSGQY